MVLRTISAFAVNQGARQRCSTMLSLCQRWACADDKHICCRKCWGMRKKKLEKSYMHTRQGKPGNTSNTMHPVDNAKPHQMGARRPLHSHLQKQALCTVYLQAHTTSRFHMVLEGVLLRINSQPNMSQLSTAISSPAQVPKAPRWRHTKTSTQM